MDYSRGVKEQLFDLSSDPAEKENVAAEQVEVLASLRMQALEYVLLRRPGNYLLATGDMQDQASITVQGTTSAVSLFGLASRPDEGGGVRFEGTCAAGLWVVAELDADGLPSLNGASLNGASLKEVPPRYERGQLTAMLAAGEPQSKLVSGPPRIASPSQARRSMDARQLEALKALGYIDEGGESEEEDGDRIPASNHASNETAQQERGARRDSAESRRAMTVGEVLVRSPSLRDLLGNRRSIGDLIGEKGLVIFFMGTECPLANLYVPRMIEMSERFGAQGVGFVGVYPHESETLPQIAAHASDCDLPFVIVKDFGQQFADAVGVERTPATVIFDGEGALRYRGRIDDQYSVAARRPTPRKQELVHALEQLLAGESIQIAESDADGCLLDRALPAEPGAPLTFTRDVAPILQERCEACHREGQIGGFALQTYEDAARRRRMLREVVVQRRMPPWHADQRFGHFANDRSLSESEIDILRRWVDQGAPRGEANDLPPAREWSGDWSVMPDVVIETPEAVDVPADGVMNYQYMTSPTDFAEDVWGPGGGDPAG